MTTPSRTIHTDDTIPRSRKQQKQPQQTRGRLASSSLLRSFLRIRRPRLQSPTVVVLIVLWWFVVMVDLSAALLSSRRGDPTTRGSSSSSSNGGNGGIRLQEFRPSSTSTFFFIRSPPLQSKHSTPIEPPQQSIHPTIPWLLIPSQVPQQRQPQRSGSVGRMKHHDSHDDDGTTASALGNQKEEGGRRGGSVQSQVAGSASPTPIPTALATGGSNPNQKRNNRRRRNNHKKRAQSTTTTITTTTSTPSSSTTKRSPRRSGNLPDIYWRSIPIEDLRHHPQFQPLPPPQHISRLETLEDIRLFQQGSWQWDAVHEGRCTTSQAAAALGFLEPKAAKFLGVPRSWQKGGVSAYYRLRKPALRTLEEMNAVLCGGEGGSGEQQSAEEESLSKDPSVWQGTTSNHFPFAAKYMVRMTRQDIQRRKELSKRFINSPGFDFSVRMMWGTAQEATALLTALNYFWQQDNGVVLKEVGMCGGGLEINSTQGEPGNRLLVGATPDGLLYYPDGTVEALEVKNHCPFFSSASRQPGHRHTRNSGHRFSIRSFDFVGCGVPPQYIPQLMMEMFCVGENCRSAVMVRQTATSGSLILRVRRDDEWIDEMIYWLRRFKEDFVDREEPPPTNFFHEGSTDDDSARYMAFLELTKALQDKVEVVAQLPHAEIQRATGVEPGMIDLFLD